MYRRCLFCHHDLGENQALDAFPVGRRLAYDEARGRLWVVCRQCERWNLTPLDERHEAIEQAERLYRGTRLRVSTEHVGLARVADGTELVRIGRPLRPELAAWRYGDQFGRRRRRQLVVSGAAAAVAGGLLVGGVSMGALVVSPVATVQVGRWLYRTVQHGLDSTTVARVRADDGAVVRVQRRALRMVEVSRGADGGLALRVPHEAGVVMLDGAAAHAAAGPLFAAANRLQGARDDVQRAVRFLDAAGSAERLLAATARRGEAAERTRRRLTAFGHADIVEHDTGLFALTPAQRLAVEMALHEARERRAIEGELRELEAAWRDAEALAAIADPLGVPTRVERAYAALRARTVDR